MIEPGALQLSDYSLTGKDTALAIERGLAEATWYRSPIPKHTLRELLERRDGPAIRNTILWFSLLFSAGLCGVLLWGTWWQVIPFAIYGVLYGSTSDSRWHESSHGTMFKTDWLNNALYEVASFMVMRESTVWRWSHARHHSDTIIVGRDPEIAVPRPPNMTNFVLAFFGLKQMPVYFHRLILHSRGQISAEEKTFIPESEYGKVIFRARIYLLIYAGIIVLALGTHSLLPLMFIGLPNLYGGWLMPIYGNTQHAGLAENVLDHRLNCRTVYMNPVNRFLYLNMNYHVEHHMFPLVPYHALPKLHATIKDDCPTPYPSIFEAWRELLPAVLRQVRDPGFWVKRKLPTPTLRAEAPSTSPIFTAKGRPVNGWIEICASSFLKKEDVLRFDHDRKSFAIYRTAEGGLYATDGFCTHSNAHLADGFVSGNLVECPKHNGRFDVTDGSPKRPPVCVALRTYQVREHDHKIFLDLNSSGGRGVNAKTETYQLRVVSNENVATFIKELVLEPEPGSPGPEYQPGDYLQFDIPAYGEMSFREIAVKAPYEGVWKAQGWFDGRAENLVATRRNYSFASNPKVDRTLRFNIRLATPPRGQDCSGGAGSAFMHRLKPGDKISASGPFGSFHIQPTEREMIYLGGGSGMAPLRSHLSYLFETRKTTRRVSFWYGARSLQECFYREYFENLAVQNSNFTFHLALSEPQPADHGKSDTGLIHEVLWKKHLSTHPDPTGIEYYLCGPPALVQAALQMLSGLKVDSSQISYDEF